MVKKYIRALIALVAILGVGTSAAHAVTFTKVLPEGLSSSPKTAKVPGQQLVSTDSGIQSRLAIDHKLKPQAIASAKVVGISRTKVKIGDKEDNSARSQTGVIAPTSYMYGRTVKAWSVKLRVSSKKTITVKWKIDCSNPFIPKKSKKRPPLRVVSKSKTFVMNFRKSQTTKRTVTCPSGQAVTVTVVTTVKGRVRVVSMTKGYKLVSQRLSAQANVNVNNRISVVCHDMPAPVSLAPAPVVVPPVIVQQTIVCGNGNVNVGNGNAAAAAGDNCNSTVAPPPPPPPAPVDNAPQISLTGSPAHVYAGGNVYGWVEASDPDGDALSVNVVATGAAHVAGVVPSGIRWDGTACPAGTKCYRYTLWGDGVGNATVTATVSANGKSATATAVVPVYADEF